MRSLSQETYTFNVTNCDKIFDLLVFGGQIAIPKGLKTLSLEQRTKRDFCKFHNFMGHKIFQCVLFLDLMQNALKDGRLIFFIQAKVSSGGRG